MQSLEAPNGVAVKRLGAHFRIGFMQIKYSERRKEREGLNGPRRSHRTSASRDLICLLAGLPQLFLGTDRTGLRHGHRELRLSRFIALDRRFSRVSSHGVLCTQPLVQPAVWPGSFWFISSDVTASGQRSSSSNSVSIFLIRPINESLSDRSLRNLRANRRNSTAHMLC